MRRAAMRNQMNTEGVHARSEGPDMEFMDISYIWEVLQPVQYLLSIDFRRYSFQQNGRCFFYYPPGARQNTDPNQKREYGINKIIVGIIYYNRRDDNSYRR